MRIRLTGESIVEIRPSGNLRNGRKAEELADHLNHYIGQSVRSVIIDCSALDYIGSDALGSLISAHASLVHSGRRLVFTTIDRRVMELFERTRLHLIFEIFATREEALASFQTVSQPSTS